MSGDMSVATRQLLSMSCPRCGPKGAVNPYIQPLKTDVWRSNLAIHLVTSVPLQ